jgi:hypothetical protein
MRNSIVISLIIVTSWLLVVSRASADPRNGFSTASIKPVAAVPQSVWPTLALPQMGSVKFGIGVDSYNTFAREVEMQNPAGRRYSLKNEYYLTVAHTTGWGLMPMAVNSGSSFADPERDAFGASDPSVSLLHPPLELGSWKFFGHVRKFFPVTDRSKDREQDHWAYFLFTVGRLSNGWFVLNKFDPHYFAQSHYRPEDPNFYIENASIIGRKILPWMKMGLGQRLQFEWHDDRPEGSSVELFPLVGLVPSSNINIEFRYFLPVQKVNAVAESPAAVAFDQGFVQIFLQLVI